MKDPTDQDVQRMSQFLTTEHFTLQGARNGTIAEANGRLGHYLSAVGSSIVALAFVANFSQLKPAFLAFSVVVFPILIVLGVMTLVRILQLGLIDLRLSQAINRIRHFYIQTAPDAEPYFSLPHFDDFDSTRLAMMPFHISLQGLASTPGPVLLINSILVGGFISILANGLLSMHLSASIFSGLAGLLIAFVVHFSWASRIWDRHAVEEFEERFPASDD